MNRAADHLRILVVDDHPLVRAGLRRTLQEASEGWRVFEAASGHEALDAMRRQWIDVVVVDLSMPGMSGLELIRRLRAQFEVARVLVLSMHGEQHYAMRALRAGADGYLTKDVAPTDIVDAVRAVASGQTRARNPAVAAAKRGIRSQEQPSHASLSDREFDVLCRLVVGRPGIQIARELHLSNKTVSTYKTRVFAKLGLKSTTGLVRYAIAHGLDGRDALAVSPAVPPASRVVDRPQT